ncbi:MAG TPA: orotidine-5'-phosphate decarboxylase [Gammaproteobacteria bacterium]|nr:orotidine-5'-phosphate decarboxylase [Gammaproteobacteria bacterium]
MNALQPRVPIIVALDYANGEDALATARALAGSGCAVKVGKELFTAEGPAIVGRLGELGLPVFLDLKFHDIPNTVAGACRAAAALGAWMINVHASGGREMLLAAREALAARTARPLLIAVTVLTSLDRGRLAEIGLDVEPAVQVERLARLTRAAGLDGVVCSPQEIAVVKSLGADFLAVTPGVRPPGSAQDDQQRIATPAAAVAAGADWLVIGRPITRAASPAAAVAAIAASLVAPETPPH